MNKIYLLLSVLLLSIPIYSQQLPDDWCDDSRTALTAEQITETQILFNNRIAPRILPGTIYIPLTIHLVARDDGSQPPELLHILEELEKLNNRYTINNTHFQYYLHDIRTLNNSVFWGGDINNSPSVAGTFNIYWSGNPNACNGYAYFPQSTGYTGLCFMGDGACTLYDFPHLLPHEVGHLIGLYHTHGKFNSSGLTDELVDGSNCTTAGDDVCDTPAEPVLRGAAAPYITADCQWIPNDVFLDLAGVPFQPDPTNVMAYTYPYHCTERFTLGQDTRALGMYDLYLKDWLQSGVNYYSINTNPNNTDDVDAMGTTYGTFIYEENYQVSVMAVPTTGFNFKNWTEAGIIVSTDANYIFPATKDRSLVANFINPSCAFTLIDARTDLPIAGYDPILEGAEINIALLGTDKINIVANQTTAGSANMNLVGPYSRNRLENYAPYAMFGDNGKGDYKGWTPILGEYTLTTTTYEEYRRGGDIVETCIVNFSFVEDRLEIDMTAYIPDGEYIAFFGECITVPVIIQDEDVDDAILNIGPRSADGGFYWTLNRQNVTGNYPETLEAIITICQTAANPATLIDLSIRITDEDIVLNLYQIIEFIEPEFGQVTSFTLVDAENDVIIPEYDPILDFAEIDVNLLPTNNLNVIANVDGEVSKVKFYLNGASARTEGKAPYALKGDNGRGDFYNWYPLGDYTIGAKSISSAGEFGILNEINVKFVDNSTTAARISSGSPQALSDELSSEILLDIYPNPASDYITIQAANRVKGDINLLIYNVNGKLVYQDKFKDVYDNQINVSNFTNGVYTLKLAVNDTQLLRKIMIMH